MLFKYRPRDPIVFHNQDGFRHKKAVLSVRRSERRVRVAHALGQLRESTAIPYLINVATKEVRVNSQGWLTYDLTKVRMAAAAAHHIKLLTKCVSPAGH